MSRIAIEFQNVFKSYTLYHSITGGIKNFLFHLPAAIRKMRANRFLALQDVSFRVDRGETLGVIGRNGAGKSTALGLVARVIRADRGRVTVDGRVSPLLELGAGFHPDLTGRDNIVLNGVLMGLTRAEVRRKLGAIVDFSELGEFIDQPVRTYSNGMLARLGFSIVAGLDPEVLLIDEILAVGDASFQAKCMDRMRRFKADGVTMVLVSHDLAAVRSMCDRAACLEKGRIVDLSEADATTRRYESRLHAESAQALPYPPAGPEQGRSNGKSR